MIIEDLNLRTQTENFESIESIFRNIQSEIAKNVNFQHLGSLNEIIVAYFLTAAVFKNGLTADDKRLFDNLIDSNVMTPIEYKSIELRFAKVRTNPRSHMRQSIEYYRTMNTLFPAFFDQSIHLILHMISYSQRITYDLMVELDYWLNDDKSNMITYDRELSWLGNLSIDQLKNIHNETLERLFRALENLNDAEKIYAQSFVSSSMELGYLLFEHRDIQDNKYLNQSLEVLMLPKLDVDSSSYASDTLALSHHVQQLNNNVDYFIDLTKHHNPNVIIQTVRTVLISLIYKGYVSTLQETFLKDIISKMEGTYGFK